jgi:hypothetical protein
MITNAPLITLGPQRRAGYVNALKKQNCPLLSVSRHFTRQRL